MVRPARAPDPVLWVGGLLAGDFLLQRLAVPGMDIPVTVPASVIWAGFAYYYRVVEVCAARALLWLLSAAFSALAVIPQLLFNHAPFVSANSWALWMVIWLPVVVAVRDTTAAQYQRFLRWVAHFGLAVSGLSTLFIVVQLLGLPYRDYLAAVVPKGLLVQGFVISYPIYYGSPLYKSNAWLTLEPSFLSFMLGLCALASIIVRVHPWKIFGLFLGLLSTTAGSGLAILMVGLIAMCFTRERRYLRIIAVPIAMVLALALATPFGRSIFSRLTEAGQANSSTSLRAIQPYLYLWPQWVNDPSAVVFGRGAGSSRWVIDNLGIGGLLVPNMPKLLFDYGLLAGTLLLLLLISTYVGTPQPVIALSLMASMLTIQAAAQPLVLCSIALCSLWSNFKVAEPWGRHVPLVSERLADERLGQWTLRDQRSWRMINDLLTRAEHTQQRL